MKKLKYLFELLIIDILIILGCTLFSTPAYSANPTPQEIQVTVANKIKVTKAEINLLKAKVKAYNLESDKTKLAAMEEQLIVLKKELSIAKELVKTKEKLDKSEKETNDLKCKFNRLFEQGINIYNRENN